MIENIIFHYTNIVADYFEHMIQSELLNKLNNNTYIFIIGLNAVLHIYKLSLLNSRSFETAQFLCQKAYYCYLEYIEQMNKSNLLHNLNNSDAIIFVYKKTISDSNILNITENNNLNNSLLTTKYFINANITESREELEIILNCISVVTKSILFFKSDYIFEKKDSILSEINNKNISINLLKTIMLNHLNNYLSLILLDSSNNYDSMDLFDYIKLIYQKTNFPIEKYNDFLTYLYKYLKKNKKTNSLPSKEELLNMTLCILYNEELINKINIYIETNKIQIAIKELFTNI